MPQVSAKVQNQVAHGVSGSRCRETNSGRPRVAPGSPQSARSTAASLLVANSQEERIERSCHPFMFAPPSFLRKVIIGAPIGERRLKQVQPDEGQ